MADFAFCLGIELGKGCEEKTCKKRDNCRYYLEDLFLRYPDALGRGELIINDPGSECAWYLPKVEKHTETATLFDEFCANENE